jgi:hypothetical protein
MIMHCPQSAAVAFKDSKVIDMMGETVSQNCGQQRAYFSSPGWYVSMEFYGDNDAGSDNPDSSTRLSAILPAETSGSG